MRYVTIIVDQVQPFMTKMFDYENKNIEQDDTPSHMGRIVRERWEEHSSEFQIKSLHMIPIFVVPPGKPNLCCHVTVLQCAKTSEPVGECMIPHPSHYVQDINFIHNYSIGKLIM